MHANFMAIQQDSRRASSWFKALLKQWPQWMESFRWMCRTGKNPRARWWPQWWLVQAMNLDEANPGMPADQLIHVRWIWRDKQRNSIKSCRPPSP